MYDKTEEAEFTAAWDKHRQRFNPFVACPECTGSRYTGQVEHEKFVLSAGGIYEPVGEWRDCENCGGAGEIQAD